MEEGHVQALTGPEVTLLLMPFFKTFFLLLLAYSSTGGKQELGAGDAVLPAGNWQPYLGH